MRWLYIGSYWKIHNEFMRPEIIAEFKFKWTEVISSSISDFLHFRYAYIHLKQLTSAQRPFPTALVRLTNTGRQPSLTSYSAVIQELIFMISMHSIQSEWRVFARIVQGRVWREQPAVVMVIAIWCLALGNATATHYWSSEMQDIMSKSNQKQNFKSTHAHCF